MEKPVSRQMHGVMDYIYATFITAAPEVMGFRNEQPPRLSAAWH